MAIEIIDGLPSIDADEPIEKVKVTIEGVEYTTNETGDILNTDGSVFKTKVDYDAELLDLDKNKPEPITLIEGEEIEIEGLSYKIDKDGNAVNDKGEVFKTKLELTDLISDDNEVEIDVNSIIKATGFDILDENNQPITFDNSPEGITAFVNAVYDKGKEDESESTLVGLYNRFPIVEKMITHLINNNGDISNFKIGVVYKDIKLDDKNEEQSIDVIRAARKLKGDTEEEIQAYINYRKNDKSLTKAGEDSLKFLQDREQESFKAELIQAETLENERIADEQAKVTSIYNIIKKGEFEIDGQLIKIPTILKSTKNSVVRHFNKETVVDYMTQKRTFKIGNTTVLATPFEVDDYIENQTNKVEKDIYKAIKYLTQGEEQLLKSAITKHNTEQVKKKLTFKSKGSASKVKQASQELDLPVK